jgi:hypothetical protein
VSENPRCDNRTCLGRPLRRCWNLSYLQQDQDEPTAQGIFLHEVVSSVLVTGSNERSWQAYGFFDTYHGDSEDRSLYSYAQIEETSLCRPDLIPLGSHTDLNHSIRDPRSYFLMVWKTHMRNGQVRCWRDLIDRLENVVAEYVSAPLLSTVQYSPDREWQPRASENLAPCEV